jgi:hypothetical protein
MKTTRFVPIPISLESGAVLDGAGTVYTGAKKLEHFYEENGVLVCDLSRQGIVPLPMRSRGFGRDLGGGHSELFIDDKPCRIAKYPEGDAFLTISGFREPVVDEWENEVGRLEAGFYYTDDAPKAWKESADIWLHGYWQYDWANSYERIDEWDKERGYIKARPPYGNYGYKEGQRFCFLNVKERVLHAGDYAIDYQRKLLYFLPLTPGNTSQVSLSVADYPCIRLTDVQNVVVRNCEICGFAGDAISVARCKNIRFENCKIYNIGGRGAVVEDSENVVFESCELYHIGESGIEIAGGDRKTLTPCLCGVRSCTLHDVSAWTRTYAPAIHLKGVGLFAEGNTVYDCPHTAIMYWGNEVKITHNTVYNVLWETGDAGAIYTGRDYTFRGNEVSDNLICLTGGVGLGTMGIYNDDNVSGTKMERNVFYKVQRAIFLGGGVDFIAKNNLFVDCDPAISVEGRGTSPNPVWRSQMQTLKDRLAFIMDENGALIAPYAKRYPELQRLLDAYEEAEGMPLIYASGEISGNVYYGKTIHIDWMANENDFEEHFVCEGERLLSSKDEIEGAVSRLQYEKYLYALALERTRGD